MFETKITPRQKFVVNLINQNEGLGRAEIEQKAAVLYPASKPTIARDLSMLLREGKIKTKGSGRSIVYLPAQDNPIWGRNCFENQLLEEAQNFSKPKRPSLSTGRFFVEF